MLNVYEYNNTKHTLLEEGDYVVKKYTVRQGTITEKITLLGSNSELGIDHSKVIVPPMVLSFDSIPSSRSFNYSLIWQYGQQLYFYTDVVQDLGFVITWLEKA